MAEGMRAACIFLVALAPLVLQHHLAHAAPREHPGKLPLCCAPGCRPPPLLAPSLLLPLPGNRASELRPDRPPLAPLICSLAGVQSINEDQHSTELELLEDPQHPVMKQPLVTRASGMQTQHQSFAQRAHHRQLGRRFERSTPTPRELKRLLGEAETWGFGGMMTFGER